MPLPDKRPYWPTNHAASYFLLTLVQFTLKLERPSCYNTDKKSAFDCVDMKLAKIKQLFPHHGLESPEEYFSELLSNGKFKTALSGRKRVAIAVGSRGISNLAMFVSELVRYLKALDIEPFIVPAMGSHGGASASGQTEVLNKLGITQESVKARILSSMDTITLGNVEMDGIEYRVYVDKIAWQADGVILINRVKPHTDFIGKYESGLVKMSTIGLGNHAGAQQVHSLGVRGLSELIPVLAKAVLSDSKIVGGFAVIEDAYHTTAGLHWLDREQIMDEEPQLLERARSLMPRLPVDNIDLLIIKQMGKEISGVGLDTKIIGRLMIWDREEFSGPRIELIGVCDITEASYGNALGVGLADFTTRKLFEKIDFDSMKENILTSTFYQRGKIPLVFEDERELLDAALQHFQRRGVTKPKVIVIKDTLSLDEIHVSLSVLEETEGRDDIELVSELREIEFDKNNGIVVC